MSIGQSVINTGRVSIRIHRDIEGPPNNPSDKQDVVWGGVEIILFSQIDC
jgi:hypothetical protein